MATLDAHSPGTHPAPESGDQLQRNLSNRHVQLIAIGGAIGTGLFMGSGKTIHAAGPSILLVYLTVGVMLFFVMRAMGELLLHNLDYKSFQDFCAEILGPWAVFMSGWTYWLCWVVTGMAEIIAVTGYWNFWVNPDHPTEMKTLSLVLAVVMLGFLLFLNLLTVRLFGEMEFWFAIIKVAALVAFLIIGVGFLLLNGTTVDGPTGFSVIGEHGGWFPNGLVAPVLAIAGVVFAYAAIELVGTAAGETEEPAKVMPRAVNTVIIRIAVFYVGSVLLLSLLLPYTSYREGVSPPTP